MVILMEIEKIMTKHIIVGSITNTLLEVALIMQKYDIGFLPIIDKNKIVGVITDRDIVINAISNNCSANDLIEKYITKNVITINQNETIDNALSIMSQKQIKRLIVISENKIVGILSLSDIINHNQQAVNIINILKQIWKINRNDDLFKTEIDEFYL